MRIPGIGRRTLADVVGAGLVGGLAAGIVVLAFRGGVQAKEILALAGGVIGAAVAVWGALYVEARKRDEERRARYDDIRKALEFLIDAIGSIAEGKWPTDGTIVALRRGNATLARMREQAQGLDFGTSMWMDWLADHFEKRMAQIEQHASSKDWASDINLMLQVEIGLGGLFGDLVMVRRAMKLEPSTIERSAKDALDALRTKWRAAMQAEG